MSLGRAPEGYHSVTPYLIVDEPERLIAFCEAAFEAETFQRIEAEGLVMHAEMRIGDAVVMCGRTPPGEGEPDLDDLAFYLAEGCALGLALAVEGPTRWTRSPPLDPGAPVAWNKVPR